LFLIVDFLVTAAGIKIKPASHIVGKRKLAGPVTSN
jgi:hypothetical protein